MEAFISGLDEDCWNEIEVGWSHPVVTDDKGVESLKQRDKWTALEKKQASCNSKAKTALYNAIDSSHFKLISQCASAQKAWKTLENMFQGTNSMKRTKLDMLASKFENLRMEKKEYVAEFSAKMCDISNESFALGKQYKDKKLVKKLKRSLPLKFESKISAVEEAHNLDEMPFDEFVGIMKAFELNKAYEDKERQKVSNTEAVSNGAYAEDSLALLTRQFSKYLKNKHNKKDNRSREEADSSSKKIQCFECKGFGHVRSECANLLKQKQALTSIESDSNTDSEDELDLKNFVALTTFISSPVAESAKGPATESAAKSTVESVKNGSDSDVDSISDEDFEKNYQMLYEHWLKLVEENSLLAKEKVKIEAQVVEVQKYAAEKEEEATQARVQPEETQKQLRMLNNGVRETAASSATEPSTKNSGKSGTATKTATASKPETATETASRKAKMF
ncbi:hypothetical protein AALP_AA7G025100 [Arabis alpina]|uniref:CCHC-type domain-containing protein n=1 Tax=Arabis alpina TaxID=50452 RepID=A0A087GFI2_ARAAL|nr:hypothetical protein AALP_AA7G025100 [Arabis alpina]